MRREETIKNKVHEIGMYSIDYNYDYWITIYNTLCWVLGDDTIDWDVEICDEH